MNSATLVLNFPTVAEAERALASLAPDNGEFCTLKLDGASVELQADAASPLGMLRSIDDILGCLRAIGYE